MFEYGKWYWNTSMDSHVAYVDKDRMIIRNSTKWTFSICPSLTPAMEEILGKKLESSNHNWNTSPLEEKRRTIQFTFGEPG